MEKGYKNTQFEIETLKEYIFKLDDNIKETSQEFMVALVMLIGLYTKDVVRIANLTGYPLKFIKLVTGRFKDHNIWMGQQSICSWMQLEGIEAIISFWMDMSIGMGKVIRYRETS